MPLAAGVDWSGAHPQRPKPVTPCAMAAAIGLLISLATETDWACSASSSESGFLSISWNTLVSTVLNAKASTSTSEELDGPVALTGAISDIFLQG